MINRSIVFFLATKGRKHNKAKCKAASNQPRVNFRFSSRLEIKQVFFFFFDALLTTLLFASP